jgi:outer membrane receptor protein involved in Fe transport
VLYNTERLPSITTTDVRLSKRLNIGAVGGRLFFDILNLFDRKNLFYIEDEEHYSFFDDPEGSHHDPGVWGNRRRIKTGIEIAF